MRPGGADDQEDRMIDVTIRGHLVIAIDEDPRDPTRADVRVVFVNSGFAGNPAPMKVSHVPAIHVKSDGIDSVSCPGSDCWLSETPYFRTRDDSGVEWSVWLVHDTFGRFGGPGPAEKVTLGAGVDTIRTPKYCYGSGDKLDQLDPTLWDGEDRSRRRVQSRFDLAGGTLDVPAPEDVDVDGRRFTMAEVIRWRAPLTSIVLAGFGGARPLTVNLNAQAAVKLVNLPPRPAPAANQDLAMHFAELYDLSAALTPPTWPGRNNAIPRRIPSQRPSAEGVEGTFCPPGSLKKKP